LISDIDSTKYPSVTSASKALDSSLMVLQIALNDHGVDGLTPNGIAKILTNKFRIRTTTTAVSMALGKATSFVNRIPDGQGFSYRIMPPGEKFLSELSEQQSPTNATPQRKRTKKERGMESPKPEVASEERAGEAEPKKPTQSVSSKSKSAAGMGPKAAVLGLMDSGFFSLGRTSPEVRDYLKKKRGFSFATDALRFTLLRIVREGKLERDENAEGQYEYKQPTA